MKLIRIFIFLFSINALQSQTKEISLEDIWENRTFAVKSVPGFNFMKDGLRYSRLDNNQVKSIDIATGKNEQILLNLKEVNSDIDFDNISSYVFSEDETKILFSQKEESIYRYSSKAEYYSFDIKNKTLVRIFPKGKIMYPHYSPQADKIGFVYENNLYYQSLNNNEIVQVTFDGKWNEIINGASDWVYEEEFTLTRSFEWSAKGDKIAYIRTDESKVKEFQFETYYNEAYPDIYKFKYPKVGEVNSTLSVWCYNLKSKKSDQINTGIDPSIDSYYPRIKWTKSNDELVITWMNRWQNHLKLLLYNSSNKQVSTLLGEKNKYYIELTDHLIFLKNGKEFLWMSEQDGTNHLYLYDMKGKLVRQITTGKNEITDFYGFDGNEAKLFFQMSEENGLERKIYSINKDGTGLSCLDKKSGNHSVQMSTGGKYFVHQFSTLNTLPKYRIVDQNWNEIRVLEDNAALQKKMTEFNFKEVQLSSIKNRNGESLNALTIKPKNFDPSKKYPVFMFLYGGPGSQQVMNRWNSFGNYWWFQMLADKGYLICVVDNRGTGGRGEEFKKMTYLQLGKYETEDQIDAAKYLATLPYVDGSRIGIYGWSYGGYMSSLCLLKGNDVFKAAIAVAPVTNWKWYDSIYTERYMRDEKENKSGYEENSPVNFADRLKGNYMLVHGIADDNVHFQNSTEMINALVKNKKQFDLMVYPNRNHSIFGENARMHLFTKMTNFVLEKI